ncbi:MAG: metal-sensing transcriptional repressor, partial [Nostoc sp.]
MNGSNRLGKESLPISQQAEHSQHQDTDHEYTDHTHGTEESTHPHVHSEESLRRIVNRLSRIEGHIRGIKGMVQQSTPCPDVLLQI